MQIFIRRRYCVKRSRVAWAIEPVVGLAYAIARWWHSKEAVRLMLDVCLHDHRPTNQNYNSPKRKIPALVQDFHPEIPLANELRDMVCDAACQRLDADRMDDEHWAVFAELVPSILSLHIRSHLSNPGDPRELQIIETIVGSDEIHRINEVIWPKIREFMDVDRPELSVAAIGAVGDMLRIGGGYDQPFGRSHRPEDIQAARVVGNSILTELSESDVLGLGARVRLCRMAAWFDIEISDDVPPDLEAFFRDLERGEDFQRSEEQVLSDLGILATDWAAGPPEPALEKLRWIKSESNTADIRWPDRVFAITAKIAEEAADPCAWLDAALNLGLLREATTFVDAAIVAGCLSERQMAALLADVQSRPETVGRVLMGAPDGNWTLDAILAQLNRSDYGVLSTVSIRQGLSDRRQDWLLLSAPDDAVAGMVAFAMFSGMHRDEPWSGGATSRGMAERDREVSRISIRER